MCLKALFLVLFFLPGAPLARAKVLHFSGCDWEVRGNGHSGPGPNYWSPTNTWVDSEGGLHLLISHQGNRWLCPELTTVKSFGFGRFEFEVAGRVDRLDRNVVLGLFTYPEPEAGPDGTCELDIEFARWGNATYPNGNYTVWPANKSVPNSEKSFEFQLAGDVSTHRFTWNAREVVCESFQGPASAINRPFMRWQFAPADAAARINRHPLPVHLNLWCYAGQPPANRQPVELVIRRFRFTPEP